MSLGGMRAENEARGEGMDHAALYSGGMKSAMDSGATRDEDGIDRVPDPPETLKPVLYELKRMCEIEHINLPRQLELAGGNHYGTMAPQKFASALVVNFNRYHFTQQLLFSITSAYGCGYEAPPNTEIRHQLPFESVAWKDFCEDVEKAVEYNQAPTELASGGSFIPRRTRPGSPPKR